MTSKRKRSTGPATYTHPPLIEIPSIHFAPRTQAVDTLVVHAMGEWVRYEDGIYYYCTDLLHVMHLSVHAFCLPDGRILQSVEPQYIAYHAREYNGRSVGMEFVVAGAHDYQSFLTRIGDRDNSPFTAAQYRAGGWWFGQMARRFHLGFEHLKSHQELAPLNKEDPGAAFNWEALKEAFNTSLS